MEFNLRAIKGFVTRAVQYTEEKLGTSDKTELDQAYEELAEKCDRTKLYTTKIVNSTMSVLEPNPNNQMTDFVLEKLDKKQDRIRNLEQLGNDMIESGLEFGSHTIYGQALIKVGKSQQQLGKLEKQFVEQAIKGFVRPLTKFLNEDVRTIMLERKILEVKRLDLDAAKNRIKKAKSLEAQNNTKLKPHEIAKEIDMAEQDLKLGEERFNKQVEITKLLLEGISSAQANHVRCLSEFVDSEIKYYTECHKQMVELQYQLAQLANNQPNNQSNNSANNQSNNSTTTSNPINSNGNTASAQVKSATATNDTRQINGKTLIKQQSNGQIFKVNDQLISELVSPSDELPVSLPDNKKRARVLYDYQRQGNDQLSLTINEIIIVDLNDTDDTDFLLAERNFEKGKVPLSYLEIMN